MEKSHQYSSDSKYSTRPILQVKQSEQVLAAHSTAPPKSLSSSVASRKNKKKREKKKIHGRCIPPSQKNG